MTALTPIQVITTYESIAGIMGNMCLAAQGANWKQLTALEKDCARLVFVLQNSPVAPELSQPQQRRKFALLQQILADDAEIRRHTEPWMENLKSLIHSTGKKRMVNQAYGVGAKYAPGAR
jgi:flagellar protein FliT